MYKNILLLVLVSGLYACAGKDKTNSNNFDRKTLLQDVANRLIKPAYSTVKVKADSLVLLANEFTQNPTAEKLTALQKVWENAYYAWQASCAYNFGAAGEEGLQKSLVEEVATFPASSTKIETAITNNQTNFTDFNRDARGFLAIEYLLFDVGNNNAQILTNFQNQNRKNYLVGLANNLKSRIETVLNSWNGAYLQDFINNDGSSAGSSTSLLYNEFVKSFEGLKNFKVALPLGKRAGQTQTEPTLVEAYYSGKSLKMLKNHLAAIEAIWRSFIPYLQSVEGGNGLITNTEVQLTALKTALQAIPETPTFSVQIQTSPASLENLYIELQKLTRYFKSDMSSLLGIAITYSSGDGD